jgi:UDP-N-acetylmuramoyl-L-alanyl-D-glutamate--2,6-diaminopimelate ligase
MGDAAAARADLVVVTDDNPRGEDAAAIRAAVLDGVAGRPHAEIGDRREAIAYAIGLARAGDVVLLAGKGHEAYQEVAGARHPFDDRAVAAEVLS